MSCTNASCSISNAIQIAIAKFFDGEAPDPVEEARVAQASTPAPSSRREALLDGSTSYPRSHASRQPAPRIIPQPDSQSNYIPPFLFQVLLTPFNLLTRVVGKGFSFIGYILSFLPRFLPGFFIRRPSPRIRTGRRPLSPRDTAARFQREFEEDYGAHALDFFDGGYATAYDTAKRDLKFLLVVLLSPEHDDTSSWVKDTLLADEVSGYLNSRQDIILWAGNVQDSEAYQVANALNCSKFPFAALIANTTQDSSTTMSTIARIVGLQSPSAFIAQLRKAVDQHAPHLYRVRNQRDEQQVSRNIREEQNSAYERSLAQDRERARQRREAEELQARSEREARAKAEAEEREAQKVDQWRRWRAKNIPSEPGPDTKEVSRVSIRLPSGERIVRKFKASASLEELYAFVECHDILSVDGPIDASQPESYQHTFKFRLVSPMPRAVYNIEQGGTIGETVGRSGNLIVESIEADEDEDED